MLSKNVSIFIMLSLFAGCQSTKTPGWVLAPVTNSSESITAVGEGHSLIDAKMKALSAINQRLWTQVSSSSQNRNIANNINGGDHYQEFNDFKLNTKTSDLVFNGVEYTKAEQVGALYYVEAKVLKTSLISQLVSDINKIDQRAKFELGALANTDLLVWWLRNRNVKELEKELAIKNSMLSAVSTTNNSELKTALPLLKSSVSRVKSQIIISISTGREDDLMKGFLTNHFSKYNIPVVDYKIGGYSHNLILDTHWNNRHIADIFVSTANVNIIMKDKKNLVVASNEIIANANSVTSFERAREGASRSFSAKLTKQNFWKALGFDF
ncbi:LPP20 family lipoprotein [Shewanella sp. VB17]|uniref:LPP20 family lipoprotein n=1 Tax=Shewanella sp. VB17 TaxID=2739432 RepID=UPI0015653119|nr:LPP20 family lipoprotein [Shewanella sp. VB17]NRD71890.1 LPP20 family lipoprotein [Shewanella sp. VB17]